MPTNASLRARRRAMALRTLAAASISISLFACASGSPQPPATTLARIDSLIGTASCDADSQCRVAAIGHRSCGGPESFRAWSTRDTQPEPLDAALQAHADERRRLQRQSGVMSTCNVLPVPAASCMPAASGAGHCVLSGPGTR